MGKLEQVKEIREDQELQCLLDDAYKILRNPIAMFDTYYSLIKHTDVATDDVIWNELISTGTFSMETQKFFANERFTFNVSNADRIVLLKSDELKYDRVLAYVFNRENIKVALLVMVESNSPFTADDFIAFSALADKVTSKIRDDEHYLKFGRAYHDSILNMVLDGDIRDTRLYAPHMQIIYDGFESYLFLALLSVGKGSAQPDKLTFIKDLLVERFPAYKFALYAGCVVMIMSSKQNSFDSDSFFGEYEDFFERNDLYAGVSSSFENLYEIKDYYDEASTALTSVVESDGNLRLSQFENFVL